VDFLDCDGDGQKNTTDLRVGYTESANPCRLLPVKVSVEWQSKTGVSTVEDHFLLAYNGY
jgi:hypothetical protein